MPVRLPVPMVLLEPVRVLLGDGVIVPVPVALLEPVRVLLGDDVGMERDAGRHGSATSLDENDAGTVDWL